jgi:hypothetical protein
VVHYGPTENLERAVSWSVAGKSAGGQTVARRCQTQATAIEWYSRLTGRGEPSGTTPSATASGTPLFKNPASPVTNGFVIVSVLIILSGWVGARLPRWGMTPMLVTGGLGVIVLILLPLLYGITGISLWPAAIAWLGFLYLWWLAALIFDLSFVWHRYICQNLGLAHLQELSTGKRVQRDRQQM